jgi:hypothetical protein
VGSHRANTAVAFFVVAALAGCRGVPNAISAFGPDGSQSLALRPQILATPTAPPHPCPAPAQKLPGRYLLLESFGTVKGTTYRAGNGGLSYWVLMKFTQSAAPTPTPHDPKPPKMKFVFYWGGYALKDSRVGCFVLFTPVDGRRYFDNKFNAAAQGRPKLGGRGTPSVVIKEGFISKLFIKGLSEKGGSGWITLLTNDRSPYTTGTVTLAGGRVISEDEAADLMRDLPHAP